jgi:hypothetical protein
MNCI